MLDDAGGREGASATCPPAALPLDLQQWSPTPDVACRCPLPQLTAEDNITRLRERLVAPFSPSRSEELHWEDAIARRH